MGRSKEQKSATMATQTMANNIYIPVYNFIKETDALQVARLNQGSHVKIPQAFAGVIISLCSKFSNNYRLW